MKGRQVCELLRRRRAVAGRAPWDDVGDIDAAAVEADRAQHPVQQLSRASDEGQTFDVFVAAGRFAHKHDLRLWVPVSKDKLRGRAFQRAALEGRERDAQIFQSGDSFDRLQRGQGCGVRREWCRGK